MLRLKIAGRSIATQKWRKASWRGVVIMVWRSMLSLCSGVAIGLGMLPVWAQSANFGTIELAPGFGSERVQGFTQGSVSLASIANRDPAGNLCVGFADSTPDHVLVLQRDLPRLSLQVSSESDTTLLVRGPGNSIRCGDDISRTNLNAAVQDADWSAGEYRIWVGSFEADTRIEYTLTVQE
ncbi:hypothetical protein H6F67_05440 [Microcoleus sp. FACHB-1515]|uniref:hypothetical protein n=1 Tax=Cyanophyceae TaxID=3028117 RepID=UPI0016825682|nr:hypothetical protein [Microcoleus sp. FACHB-1515]MBD2089294.1 hypothetical protein [Microcoleus sp. FACHB-1515]